MQMNRALRYMRTAGNGDPAGTPLAEVKRSECKVDIVGNPVDAVFGYVVCVAACVQKLGHADSGPRLVDALKDKSVKGEPERNKNGYARHPAQAF